MVDIRAVDGGGGGICGRCRIRGFAVVGNDMTSDVIWTAREAMACAYCWSEFNAPEKCGFGTPEQYWLHISPVARARCRTAANRLLLLATARGMAIPMIEPDALTASEMADIGAQLAIKSSRRIDKILRAVRSAYAKRCAHDQ